MSVCMYPSSEPRCSPIQDEMVFSMSRCSTPARALEGGMGMDSSRRATLLQDYFKTNSALTRSIIMEKSTLEQQHRHNWSILSESKRDQLVNEYFVPLGVREQYEGGFVGGSGWRRGIRPMRSVRLSESADDDMDAGLDSFSNDRFYRAGSLEPHMEARKQPPTPSTGEQMSFNRTKLRSYSMRMKKGASGSRLAKINTGSPNEESSILQREEVIPVFERDVNELDNDIDLPDESLMNDHISASEKEAGIARLRPLRYSFGRKIKNKVNHSGASTPMSEPNDFIITNQHTDSVYMGERTSPAIRVEAPTDMPTSQIAASLSDIDAPSMRTDSRIPSTSSGMLLDDAISVTSRQSVRSPDSVFAPSSNARQKQRTVEMSLKHPLSKSVRAGSSYMTVTSEFADRRQQFRAQMRKRTALGTSPSSSPTPSEDDAPIANSLPSPEGAKSLHGPSPLLKTTPITKTNSLTESSTTDLTASPTELQSPSCSPPASPIAPSIANKRESGYMSSSYDPLEDDDGDLSDTEEKPSTDAKRRYTKHRQVRPSY